MRAMDATTPFLLFLFCVIPLIKLVFAGIYLWDAVEKTLRRY
jgi:hypothetical protein